jgi:hypothetical protein
MRGAIPPLLNMPSWRVAQLKVKVNEKLHIMRQTATNFILMFSYLNFFCEYK